MTILPPVPKHEREVLDAIIRRNEAHIDAMIEVHRLFQRGVLRREAAQQILEALATVR